MPYYEHMHENKSRIAWEGGMPTKTTHKTEQVLSLNCEEFAGDFIVALDFGGANDATFSCG